MTSGCLLSPVGPMGRIVLSVRESRDWGTHTLLPGQAAVQTGGGLFRITLCEGERVIIGSFDAMSQRPSDLSECLRGDIYVKTRVL